MQKLINIATLNFTGENNSPFEYHDGSEEQVEIDKIYWELFTKHKIFTEHKGDKFAWNHGKVDMKFQKERYSPSYRADCGVVDGRFLTLAQFDQAWEDAKVKSAEYLKTTPITEEQLQRVKVFDGLVYRALFRFVYGYDFDDVKAKAENPDKYIQFCTRMHSKRFLDADYKMQSVKSFIEEAQVDVMCLQEAGQFDQKFIPANYSIVRHADSAIIYNNMMFEPVHDEQFIKTFGEQLDFNKDSVFLLTDKYLFISAHLTSKETNIEQAKQMWEVLRKIRKARPNIDILVGMDANHQLSDAPGFEIYPQQQLGLFTSTKQRTNIQMQIQKANKKVNDTKDAIVSNLLLQNKMVCSIRQDKVDGLMLPCEMHPYDHFVVKASANPSIKVYDTFK